ncbi:FABP family protein [Brevibacterium sp. 50QC2O2]|uniref:FABP family protein n=1 Tax=Brevibacterium TaxID=1696 RepID=UPI00211C8890|nr:MULTISPECIES: FABP family protein [unclassified Brevibacterium]MCQ9368922.1 FABP family protein [Brevibacterium sp. 91QC2O2]MCQ9386003.1 FABP family protein [Brevibacterium sp. 68QC2CO]MCQ9387706.1 FABP family protein [Brevibacterium sp. 50QC2O2]
MAFTLDADLNPELVPLSWLIGSWEGVGVVGYGDAPNTQFGQRIDFVDPAGAPYLHYTAQSWLLDESGQIGDTLSLETGIWQLVRPRADHDAGPGLLAPTAASPFTTAEAVESMRRESGDFGLEVSIVQPHGIVELYTGRVDGPRIDLSTDIVARTKTSKDYRASTRMYGLVEGDLLWAWDMAALGRELGSHASARLKRVA